METEVLCDLPPGHLWKYFLHPLLTSALELWESSNVYSALLRALVPTGTFLTLLDISFLTNFCLSFQIHLPSRSVPKSPLGYSPFLVYYGR